MTEKTRIFIEKSRALALALKDPDTDPEDGHVIANEFVEAFDAMEAEAIGDAVGSA